MPSTVITARDIDRKHRIGGHNEEIYRAFCNALVDAAKALVPPRSPHTAALVGFLIGLRTRSEH